MIRKLLTYSAAAALGASALASPVMAFEVPQDTQIMRRLYNTQSGEHFYTASEHEYTYLISIGWEDEGFSWIAPALSSSPVYRLYNSNAGDHHYTLDETEKDYLVSIGWHDEGIGWYSSTAAGSIPVFRQYNPNAVAGAHNFTPDINEDAQLGRLGWHREGTAWQADPSTQDLLTANAKETNLEATSLDDYTLPKNILRKANQVSNSLSSYLVKINQADMPAYWCALSTYGSTLFEVTYTPMQTVRVSESTLSDVKLPFSDSLLSIKNVWSSLIAVNGDITSLNSPSQNAGLVGQSNYINLPTWLSQMPTKYEILSRSSDQIVIKASRSYASGPSRSQTYTMTIDGSFHLTSLDIETTNWTNTVNKESYAFSGFNADLIDKTALSSYFVEAQAGTVKTGDHLQDAMFALTETARKLMQ